MVMAQPMRTIRHPEPIDTATRCVSSGPAAAGRRRFLRDAGYTAAAGLLSKGFLAAPAAASTREDAESVVANAYFAVGKIFETQYIGQEARAALRESVAVLIAPEIYSGGFFIGAARGQGVLLAQDTEGYWSYPPFYSITSGSVGVQFGFEIASLLVAVRTRFGLSQIINGGSDLGSKVSIAAGRKGAGKQFSSVGRAKADLVSFAISEGAFVSVGLDASVISVEASLAEAYYGDTRATPKAIISGQYFSNPHADALRERLRTLLGH